MFGWRHILGALLLAGACGVRAHTPETILMSEFRLKEHAFVYDITTHLGMLDPLRTVDVDAMNETHHQQLEDFFAKQMPVAIDGIGVRPILDRIEVKDAEWMANEFFEEMESGDGASITNEGRIATVVLKYPVKTSPNRISMVWDIFPESDDDEVYVRFYAAGKWGHLCFTPAEPGQVWHREDRVLGEGRAVEEHPVRSVPIVPLGVLLFGGVVFLPAIRIFKLSRPVVYAGVAALVLVAVGGWSLKRVELRPPSYLSGEAEAESIFNALHENIYRAFDYERDGDIYDALAQSVTGNLLEEVYADVYESLVLRENGGAVCSIEAVEISKSEIRLPKGLTRRFNAEYKVICLWTVRGIVEHWGHAHKRLNRYKANYTLRALPQGWRIVDVEMLEQERLDDNPESETGK